MKILLDARAISDQPHGIGRYTLDLIHGLLAQGHSVSTLVSSSKLPQSLTQLQIEDVLVLPAPFTSLRELFQLPTLGLRWDLNKYDIIHFPSFSVPHPWSPIPWSRVVVTIHDLIHLDKPNGSLKSKFKWILFWLYYFAIVFFSLHKARAVITVSDWSRNRLLKLFGLAPAKVFTVRNGLSDFWFQDPVAPRTNPLQIICLSNLKPHKNILTLISACRELWQAGASFQLVLSLSGQKIPEEWNLNEYEKSNIRLIEGISEEKLIEEIKNSIAMVCTSLIEGFSYPAAEALALNKKVILSRGTAHDEFKGSRVLFYGEPRDVECLKKAILNVLKDKNSDQQPYHNVTNLNEMIQKTLLSYGKTRGLQ